MSVKRHVMAMALLAGLSGLAVPGPVAQTPGKQPKRSGPPPIRRYKKDIRVKKTKQDDQPAKEARRAARQANDKQTMERQRAKWGEPNAG